MQFSIATALVVFLGFTSAAPADLEVRAEPSNEPVTLEHAPDSSKTFKCGKNTYNGHDIYLAAQRGVKLQAINETRGKKKFPHSFDHDDSKGHKLKFPSYCPEDKDRMEFPLVKNGPYNGGPNNQKHGDERVVYFYEDGEVDNNGHDKATYCGIMTHVGAAPGCFLMC